MNRFYQGSDKFYRDQEEQVKLKQNKNEIKNVELAQAYVPFQKLNRIFGPEESLSKGTIFPDLYKPYNPYIKK